MGHASSVLLSQTAQCYGEVQWCTFIPLPTTEQLQSHIQMTASHPWASVCISFFALRVLGDSLFIDDVGVVLSNFHVRTIE